MLAKIETLEKEAAFAFWGGMGAGLSYGKIRSVIVRRFEARGVEPPADVLAFATGGQIRDADVADWRSRLNVETGRISR